MYQVTAFHDGEYGEIELGYGEGEGRDYAIAECVESMTADWFFPEDVIVSVRHNSRVSRMPLTKARQIANRYTFG